jgi:hypothetical protein
MTKHEFASMLQALAEAWTRRDHQTAARFFTPGVQYADPLRYTISGRDTLLAFFTADDGLPQTTRWHNIVFDEERQIGAAEYTYTGTHCYHGVALVRLDKGMISHWREYQHIDVRAWEQFAGNTAFES